MPRPTSRLIGRLAALLAGLGYAATAAIPATVNPAPDRWEQLRATDLRVAGVAYRLSVGAAQLCPNALAPQAGLVLHSLDQYDPADRQGAALGYRLGSYVGVMAVVAGSPAQQSGLAADDQLVSVNGRALSVGAASATGPARAAVAFAQAILTEEMAKGEVVLRIARAEGVQEVRFTAETGCASEVELVPGEEVNAWADGQRVVVSTGMVAHCTSDDHLALVIAHELAHNLLHHGRRSIAASLENRAHRLTAMELAESQGMEEEADQLGVRLASAAAFDLSDAPAFVSALLSPDGPDGTASTHPGTTRRLAVLKAQIAAVKRQRGL